MPRTFESGTGTSGIVGELEININQVAHGFAVGDVIKSSGASNDFDLAQADSPVNAEVVGIVASVSDVNNFAYISSAVNLATAATPVGVAGQAVWLDPAVAGGMTVTKPTTNGQVTRPLGTIIESGVSMYFDCSGLAEELTAAGSLSNYRVFQSGGGGGGGSVSATFIAGEAIWGATNPKAVFVGNTFDQGSLDGKVGNFNSSLGASTYDVFSPIGSDTHSPNWASTKFAYKITGTSYTGSAPRRTFNQINFNKTWNNNFLVDIDIDFYNAGILEPAGAPFYSTTITVDADGGGDASPYWYYLGDNIDCTTDLGGGNNYWVTLTFGAAQNANPIDIGPKTSAIPPNFLQWNGAAWVAPFTTPTRVPGFQLFLAATIGQVYNSLDPEGDGQLEYENENAIDQLMFGRQRFMGFVIADVAQGGTATVIKDGVIDFTTPLMTATDQTNNFKLGSSTLGGIARFTNDVDGSDDEILIIKTGIAVDELRLSINRNITAGYEHRIGTSALRKPYSQSYQ
jgi:hypothetical protein